jgi:hypothetical protein
MKSNFIKNLSVELSSTELSELITSVIEEETGRKVTEVIFKIDSDNWSRMGSSISSTLTKVVIKLGDKILSTSDYFNR